MDWMGDIENMGESPLNMLCSCLLSVNEDRQAGSRQVRILYQQQSVIHLVKIRIGVKNS